MPADRESILTLPVDAARVLGTVAPIARAIAALVKLHRFAGIGVAIRINLAFVARYLAPAVS